MHDALYTLSIYFMAQRYTPLFSLLFFLSGGRDFFLLERSLSISAPRVISRRNLFVIDSSIARARPRFFLFPFGVFSVTDEDIFEVSANNRERG